MSAAKNEEKDGKVKPAGKKANETSGLIKSFLRDKDVAPWFRGTSIFHLQGSNELFNAIRDDTEQRTTHRVRHCLNLIGLDPMITSKDIAFLMRVSRGNDLAFLWFLLEIHYKVPNAAQVGLNEQLICSAICHLDMVTTLRELDKVLPPGSPPQGKDANTSHTSHEAARLDVGKKKQRTAQPKYMLPYFEKQRRPKVYGLPLTVTIPNFEVTFGLYAKYKDPNYKVPNEANRWFADYDFHPGRRVTYDIIKNAMSEIFQNFEAAKLRASTINTLCKHHKVLKKLEDNFKNELIVQVRDRCLKNIFGNYEEKKKHRLQQVVKSLHDAAEEQLAAFHRQTSCVRRKLTLKTLTSDGDIANVIVGSEYDNCCCMLSSANAEAKLSAPTEKKENVGDAATPKEVLNNVNLNKGSGDFVENKFAAAAMEVLKQSQIVRSLPAKIQKVTTLKTPSQLSIFTARYLQNYDYGHTVENFKPPENFFSANTSNQPYQFDYRQIFIFKKDYDYDPLLHVREAFLEALDKDIATLTELEAVETTLTAAAAECASNDWKTELVKYEAENENVDMDETQNIIIDPENKRQLDKMLENAFKELRKNPKFVLAQLPDAHKLPMLREWIAQRYGKVYSFKQRKASYKYSTKVFHALDRMSFDFPTPTAASLGKKTFVDYSCRNYLVQKIKLTKDKYYQRLDDEIMEQSRNYWFAMRAHLCSNGPPRKMFFGYMPSRVRDIQHFRLWRANEHRRDKEAYDKRLSAQRRNAC